MTLFLIAFTGCPFLSEYNSNFAHSFTVRYMALNHLVSLDSFVTQLWLNEDLIFDVDHANKWSFQDTRTMFAERACAIDEFSSWNKLPEDNNDNNNNNK